MGYPVSYRTSAARKERQLSRPDFEPSRPGDFNKPYQPDKPANDPVKPWWQNDPGGVFNPDPSIPFPERRRNPQPSRIPRTIPPALRKNMELLLMLHPALRIGRILWKLWDLYDHMRRVGTTFGSQWDLICSTSISSGCDIPGVPCVNSYCGPVVFFPALNAALCGLAGQAHAGSRGTVPNGQSDGILVQVLRAVIGANGQQFCQPARIVTQFRHVGPAFPNQRMRQDPYMVPWLRTYPAPWAPMRWYKPQVFMKPGLDWDISPMAPPFNMISERTDADMWPGTRANSAPEEAAPWRNKWPETAFRERTKPRNKEKKFQGQKAWAKELLFDAFRAHGKLTDFRDILGAFNDALPPGYRLKGKEAKKLGSLLRNVWVNFDRIDGEKALTGVIKELAEDVVGGFGDMLKTKAAAKFGWSKQKLHLSPRF